MDLQKLAKILGYIELGYRLIKRVSRVFLPKEPKQPK